MALLFTGCAMDDWYESAEVPDRDYMEVDFAVPEPTVVETRAGTLSEDNVNDVVVFFFKKENDLASCTRLQSKRFYFANGKCVDQKIEYNGDLKNHLKTGTVRVVAVANTGMSESDAEGIANLQALQAKYESTKVEERASMNMTMSGFPYVGGADKEELSRTDLNQKVTINLYRNAAKATVTLTANDDTKDFALSRFALWSFGKKGYYVGAAYKKKEGIKNDVTSHENEFGNWTDDTAYGYGQQGYTTNDSARNELGKDKRAYVIVEGTYKMQKCYYRVDLIQKEKDATTNTETTKYLFLTPNHEYKINIIKVRCKGYDTPEEAAKHPMSDFMEVEIHDHLSSVLSMTSDGLRELGVTKDVYHHNTDTDNGLTFVMKLYSHVAESEYPTLALSDDKKKYTGTDFSMEITQGDWLTFASQNGNGSDTGGETHDGAGKVYTIGLKYDTASKLTGELEGTIRINWKGLTRDVKVTWKRDFKPEDICNVTLKISVSESSKDPAGTAVTIDDYWKFLAGTHAQKLFGVAKEQNNGQVRNEGFHLPLYYGGTEDASKWKYTYTITPKSTTSTIEGAYDASSSASQSAARAFEGIDAFANLDSHITKSGNSIILETQATEYAWNYMVGKIIIKIDGVEYPFDLYHTGFFHKETTANAFGHVKGQAPSEGYYYYEVRTINYKNDTYHWLDRNVGATAGTMAIRDGSGADLIGNNVDDRFNNGAVGAYITPAPHVAYANVEEKIYKNLCPPGFRIPTSKEWDDMRNSGQFITSQTMADGVPFYQACLYDNRGREVFFPKVLYQTTEGLVGDASAGYYWTRTAASGIEKTQIGRWMKAMYMSGSSNAMINGAVNDYGMQIRAISGYDSDSQGTQTTIGFKVKGATHVYIYDAGKPWPYDNAWGPKDADGKCTYFDENKYGMVTWPGQAIGEPSTMLYDNTHSGNEFTFTYTTTTPKENLRVLFAYVENGKIRVFDRVTESGKTGTDQYNGWPILDSYAFKFTNDSKTAYTPTIDGTVTAPTSYQYVIRWPQIGDDNDDYYRINVEYKDGGCAPGFTSNVSEQFNQEFANPKRFAWVFVEQAPDADQKMIIHIYKHNDSAEKTYKYEVSRDDFTKDEVVKNKNSKVLDLTNAADFIDGHDVEGGVTVTYKYRLQWPQIGNTTNDYSRVYLEYSDGSKVADFNSGSPKTRSGESGSDGNKVFWYDFEAAPSSKPMKLTIYKSSDDDKLVYDGTISLSNFNVTEDIDETTKRKVCKITDKNKFKEVTNPTTDYSKIYVKVLGDFNNWQDGGKNPESDGIARFEGLAIGNGNFRIQVWDGTTNHNYSTGSTLQQNNWVAFSNENSNSMTISGASSGDKFDVEWDYENKKIKVTKVGSSTPTSITIYFNNNWSKSSFKIHYWIDSNKPITTWGSLPDMSWVKDNWYVYEIPQTDVQSFLIRYNDSTNTADYNNLQQDISTHNSYVLRYEFDYYDNAERVKCLGAGAP